MKEGKFTVGICTEWMVLKFSFKMGQSNIHGCFILNQSNP